MKWYELAIIGLIGLGLLSKKETPILEEITTEQVIEEAPSATEEDVKTVTTDGITRKVSSKGWVVKARTMRPLRLGGWIGYKEIIVTDEQMADAMSGYGKREVIISGMGLMTKEDLIDYLKAWREELLKDC
ncbi:MAG: hypothetical protein H3Z51_13725 [archaeon]|nr:hypothetical protein [archaeon]